MLAVSIWREDLIVCSVRIVLVRVIASFWTTETQGWKYAIAIDSGNDRKLLIWHDLAKDGGESTYQAGNGVQWPFDKWFKIGVEFHLRPYGQNSLTILYQDDVEILRTSTTVRVTDTEAPQAWMFHWGLYQGRGQKTLAIYNGDIAIYDLT